MTSAVALALRVQEEPGKELSESVAAHLGGKQALLVLDNAEHLMPEVADHIAALRDISGPTLMVTSRERLQLQGEQVYSVPSLEEHDGVELFLNRARAIDPEVELVGIGSRALFAAGQPPSGASSSRRPAPSCSRRSSSWSASLSGSTC